MFTRYIGIDISKNWFDVHMDNKNHRIQQSKADTFLKEHKASLEGSLCVVESTGGYERALAQMLAQQGVAVHVAHPNRVAAFMRARHRLAKTDVIDAQLLAEYGKFIQVEEIRLPATPQETQLECLQAHVTQLKAMVHQTKCRGQHPGKEDAFLQASMVKILKTLEEEIKACETKMVDLVNQTPALKEVFEIVTSMPGVGTVVGLSLVCGLPELGRLTKKEIAALVGVAPITRESGMRRSTSHIGYGRGNVRRVMYMGALVACRHNATMRVFYERLIGKGKPKKVGVIAVLRKMLITLNAMVKTKTRWNEHQRTEG